MVSLNSDRRLQLSMDDDEMLLPRRTSHEHDPVLATANAHGSAHGGAHGSGSRRMRLRTGWSVALGIVLLVRRPARPSLYLAFPPLPLLSTLEQVWAARRPSSLSW